MAESLDCETTTYKRQGPMPWMVTFGDLLTLLLCFFLCIVSLGPIGHDVKNKKNKEDRQAASEKRDTVLLKGAPKAAGTVIADNKPNGSLSATEQTVRLVMQPAEFESSSAQAVLARAIEDGRAQEGVRIADLALQGCGAGKRDQEFTAPLTALYEQARLKGVSDAQLRIGLGSGCSSSEEASGSIVAVLRFVNHG